MNAGQTPPSPTPPPLHWRMSGLAEGRSGPSSITQSPISAMARRKLLVLKTTFARRGCQLFAVMDRDQPEAVGSRGPVSNFQIAGAEAQKFKVPGPM